MELPRRLASVGFSAKQRGSLQVLSISGKVTEIVWVKNTKIITSDTLKGFVYSFSALFLLRKPHGPS